jgi:hypothetical protein
MNDLLAGLKERASRIDDLEPSAGVAGRLVRMVGMTLEAEGLSV